ncbi:dihydrodipicolinate reductase C-terminal domain-containing protein [Streptomyces sp. SP17BM10]|uniref:dihydrodipicolinate reductase C-terminal domain-containing protein n=1 Tax=Streptomyces sp. SP17BM10 TaxID=3002530 RepID=UPI002E7A0D7D|nr:dihydrodipicolinate reductase C-terminal domain-containing protein [Streptomyces sp. SP17BM10]MEE1782270.1 dihydrodipicolinate reductase C-terminal domain-containing protein [Streptomyces sp. SP17BM10]
MPEAPLPEAPLPEAPVPEAAAHPRPTIGIVGLGRLGSALRSLCEAEGTRVTLTASRRGGWSAEDVPDVLVDASAPDAHTDVLDYCATRRVPLVACVSNLTDAQGKALAELAGTVPVVRATNLAFGHYLQARIAELTAALATGRFEATTTVRERHPLGKAHRPSATALALARTWENAGGRAVADISDERAGLPVSEHELTHTWDGEALHVRHHVADWTVPARGALAAAAWARTAPPGLVTMRTVFDDLTAPTTPATHTPPTTPATHTPPTTARSAT